MATDDMGLRSSNPPTPTPVAPGQVDQSEQQEQRPQQSQPDPQAGQFSPLPLAPSTQIEAARYNPKTLELEVDFQYQGASYRYADVDQLTINGWVAATSVGKYFNQRIRNQFSYQQLS